MTAPPLKARFTGGHSRDDPAIPLTPVTLRRADPLLQNLPTTDKKNPHARHLAPR